MDPRTRSTSKALIADIMIVRQLKIIEKVLNRGQVALNDHETMVQSTVQSRVQVL